MLDKPSEQFGWPNQFASSVATHRGNGRKRRYLFDRMWVPEIGDLVFEMSTAYRCEDDDKHVDAVGYLLSTGEETDDAGNPEDVYRIMTLDGREARWSNATFLARPEERIEPGERQAPTGGSDPEPSQSISTEKRYISDAEDMLFDIEERDRLDAGILTNVKRDSINMMREFEEMSIADEERVVWIAKNYLLSCDDVRRALLDGPDYDREKCQKEADEARKSSLPRKYLSFSEGRK